MYEIPIPAKPKLNKRLVVFKILSKSLGKVRTVMNLAQTLLL